MSDWTWTLPTGNAPGQAPPPMITVPPTTQPAGQPPTLPPVNRPSDPSLWVTPETLPPPARDPTAPANGQPPAPGFLPNGQPDPNYRWGPQPPTTTPPGQPPGTGDVPQGAPVSPSTGAPAPTTGWQDPRSPTGRGYGWPGGRQSPFYGPNDPMMGLGPQLRMAGPAGGLVIGSESGGQNRIGPMTDSGYAEGYYQITTGTWNQFAPMAGVNLQQYPDPMHAPFDVQTRVANIIPMARWTAGWPAVRRQYPWATGDMTLGQVNQLAGGQGLASPEERGPDEWGRPYRGPGMGLPGMMPTPQQIPSIMQNNALPLLAMASAALHAPLWMMLGAYGKYLQASNQRQILDQKLNQTKWQNALKEATAQQELEGQAYGDAFANAGNDPQQLDERLAEIANRFGDTAMLNALQQGGARSAYQLQQYRDQHGQMIGKASLQAQKDQFNEEMQIYRGQMEALTYQNQVARSANEAASQNREIDAQNAKNAAANQQRESLIAAGVPANQLAPPLPMIPHVAAPGGAGTPAAPAIPPMPQMPSAPGTQTLPPPPWATGGDGGGAAPGSAPPGGAPATETPPPATETPPPATAAADPSTTPPPAAAEPPEGAPPPAAPGAPPPAEAPPAPAAAPPAAGPQAAPPLPGSTKPPPPPGQPSVPPASPAASPMTRVQTAASQLLNGGDPDEIAKTLPKDAMPYAGGMALDNWAKLQGLADSGLHGQSLLDRIRQIDPTMADTVAKIAANKEGLVSASGFASRLANYTVTMQNLAQAVNPGWRQQQYSSLQEFRTSFNADKPVGRTLQRTDRLLRFSKELADDANHLPNTNMVSANQLIAWFQSGVVGDPRYTKFITDWRNFAGEAQAVTNMGNPTVTLTSHMIDTLKLGATPQMIRQGLAEDLKGAIGSIDPVMAGWHNAFRDEPNPYMFNQGVYGQLNQLASMNVNTGALPPMLPPVGTAAEWGGKTHYYLGGDYEDPLNWGPTDPQTYTGFH